MPQFQPKRQQQILEKMLAKVVTRSDLSDVSDTSVIKHLLAAAARSDDEQYYQMTLLLQLFSIDTARGDDLDQRAAEIQPGDITRNGASKATGEVVFTRTGTTGTVNIPIGTKVKTDDGEEFTTTVAGIITPASPEQIAGNGVGRDSNLVAVVAASPGSSGNVASDTIVKFSAKPAGVDEVTNPSGTLYGAGKETDDAFRARIKAYIASLPRCTVDGLESAVLGATDDTTGASILFAYASENPSTPGRVTLYIDDGTGSAESTTTVSGENVTSGLSGPPADSAVGGETRLTLDYKPVKGSASFTLTSSTRGALTEGTEYELVDPWGLLFFDPALTIGEVITASYTRYTGLVELAQLIIDGDPNDRDTYPGYRAAGVLVTVAVPQVLLQNVVVTLTVVAGYTLSVVVTAVEEAIKNYINSLPISGDVLRNELIAAIMDVDGVYNCQLIAPATDVVILDDQLVRTTDANILVQ